ncbi:MAG: UvrD-helicase domain-containing protein [Spirochaetia bacterium]|nr:UvrD-helicase domain-containing protein [Spirochaetia bacterium]
MMTQEQSRAAQSLWQNNTRQIVQLIAGAGSGKTTTLIETVAEGIRSGFPAEKICMITFTRKAAAEMGERLKARGISAGYTGTMHALGYRILRSQANFKKTLILHREKILTEILKREFRHLSHIPPKVILHRDFLKGAEKEKMENLYRHYKRKHCLIDLDDLVLEAAEIIRKFPESFGYTCILVDEFQDTSPDQMHFIKSIQFEKLFVVGDDWQSIYMFRGADVNIAIDFQKHFPEVKRLFLTDNFRSQRHIVKLGNKAIRLSSAYIRKKLRTQKGNSIKPVCHIVHGIDDIEIIWRLYHKKHYLKENLSGLTILVRTNYLKQKLWACVPPEVHILTIHGAKGLEFDNVLVFGVARHIFPHRWNQFDEEVRLLYVAITRAKKRLEFLSWEDENTFSGFMPFLTKNCRLNYLATSWRGPEQMQ